MASPHADPIHDLWDRLSSAQDVARSVRDRGGPELRDLVLRKTSDTARVYCGELDGTDVYLKCYLSDEAPTIVTNCLAEIARVDGQMTGSGARVAKVIWAQDSAGMILTEAVPGTEVAALMERGEVDRVMPATAEWLLAYLGAELIVDGFSAGFWVTRREAADLDRFARSDRILLGAALDLQRERARQLAGVMTLKARIPAEFAPQNLTLDRAEGAAPVVWGYDIEGTYVQPVGRAVARFALASERRVPGGGARRFGLLRAVVDPLLAALAPDAETRRTLPFILGDSLIEAVLLGYGGDESLPGYRAALAAMLDEGA